MSLVRSSRRAHPSGGQRLVTEHERHRMVGRKLAGSDRMWFVMPARTEVPLASW